MPLGNGSIEEWESVEFEEGGSLDIGSALEPTVVGDFQDPGIGALRGPKLDEYFPKLDEYFLKLDEYFPELDEYFPRGGIEVE